MNEPVHDGGARAMQNLRRWDMHIHAFVQFCDAGPPAEGPLAGLTVGVKDIIDVAKVPTRIGSDACKDDRMPPAERLRKLQATRNRL